MNFGEVLNDHMTGWRRKKKEGGKERYDHIQEFDIGKTDLWGKRTAKEIEKPREFRTMDRK